MVLAEDLLAGCVFDDAQCVWHDVNTGLYEISHDLTSGIFRAENRQVVVCLLGRADLRRGRSLAAMIERFIDAGKSYAPQTQFIMTGPVPNALDGERTLDRMRHAWLYMEERLSAEYNFHFCRAAERFVDKQGIRPCMITDQGLTPRGADAVVKDVTDFVNSLLY